MEAPEKRHSVVEPRAFKEMDAHKHATAWWRALKYTRDELPWMDVKSEFLLHIPSWCVVCLSYFVTSTTDL